MFLSKLNVSIFPIGALALILANDRGAFKGTKERRLFCVLVLFTLCAAVTDVLGAWLAEAGFAGTPFSDWAARFMACLVCAAIPATWLLYVYSRVYSEEDLRSDALGVALLIMPSVASLLIALTTPFSDFAFHFDYGDMLRESNGYIAVTIMSLLVTLFSLIIATVEAVRASSLERRRLCLLLALFSFLPLIVQTVDILTHNNWTVYLLYTAELVILYMNVQTAIITSDALTGLNNRSEFDKYLEMMVGRGENNPGFYLFIIDIDDFKSINDRYGHVSGDEALRRMADVLRETFGLSNAFFARIGGDEFGMIIDMGISAAQITEALNEALRRSDERVGSEYALSVSVGYSVCERGTSTSAVKLFEEADGLMYAQKKSRGGKTA